MPPRGMNFDSALLKIAADPEGYAKQLDEFDKRRAAADEAEAKARAEEQRAAAFTKAEDEKIRAAWDGVRAERATLDIRIRDLNERDAAIGIATDKIRERQEATVVRETAVRDRERDQEAERARLLNAGEAANRQKAALDARERDVSIRETSVANREALLANRAKALIADL